MHQGDAIGRDDHPALRFAVRSGRRPGLRRRDLFRLLPARGPGRAGRASARRRRTSRPGGDGQRPVVLDSPTAPRSPTVAGGWSTGSTPSSPDGGPHGLGVIVGTHRRRSRRPGSSRPISSTTRSGRDHWGWNPFSNSLKSLQPSAGGCGDGRGLRRRRRSGQPHRWIYRGQILPTSRRVDDPGGDHGPRRPTADGSRPTASSWSTARSSIR